MGLILNKFLIIVASNYVGRPNYMGKEFDPNLSVSEQ
jgi:hypothetical protein